MLYFKGPPHHLPLEPLAAVVHQRAFILARDLNLRFRQAFSTVMSGHNAVTDARSNSASPSAALYAFLADAAPVPAMRPNTAPDIRPEPPG